MGKEQVGIEQNSELLRFVTAGSVDDGKSTLIGRLLFDSKTIHEDQLEAVAQTSKKRGLDHIDLSLLTDGLKDEREQGITIDVAYRYFSTPKRKFIIADCPGHIQYTRNMVTGASTANLALLLIDARKGVIEQTKRHAFLSSLLQIPHIVLCVNKMDLVDYSEEVFNQIVSDFKNFAVKLETKDIRFIPISALEGDNIVDRSKNMSWYNGSTLLDQLETIHIGSDANLIDCRFPVQTVIRPHKKEFHDHRSYAGRVEGGIFKKGDKVMVMPSGLESTIKAIHAYKEELKEAFPPMSVSIELEDDIDVGRGDMIVRLNNQPNQSQELDVMLCWMNDRPMPLRGKFGIRQTTRNVRCAIQEILYRVDVNTLHREEDVNQLQMNDIARVKIRTTAPLLWDSYSKNRNTGSIILVDEQTNETVAAGMII
ncbi:MAG TPA: sulfate adenylyltransferase subunit CysN [Flavobacteriales bacterium]|jgi:sulfate adenylyltransferase subunit 1|nr:sulfate adenylyltransferase subunit CysN [Flavobacteriales bacterium]